ncbi:MAG: efflux RND transporter periplasmic adaptor subunit [Aquabacterium sp.]
MRPAPARLDTRRARFVTALAAAVLLAACGGGKPGDKPAAAKAGAAAASKAAPALLLSAEDLHTVEAGNVASGPVISGSLQPEKRADLRAEISAIVLQVLKDNGEPVRAGELLVRLDDSTLRDALASAEESARTAQQAVEQATRMVVRQKALREQGMTSMQALEDAELRRTNAHSDLSAAQSRAVSARQQMKRTEVRAPFDGVVGERRASAGDTAAIGKELLKVWDPRSTRFEGLVSADRMQELKVGAPVSFRVNGFPGADFAGRIQRVDAAANATTRQVEVIVAFRDPATAPRVAGLFAEGRVESGSSRALMVPEAMLLRQGEAAQVWRVEGGAVRRVPVTLGERDARRGEYPVLKGLAEGDRILRRPGTNLADGQKVEMTRAAPVAGAPAPAPAAPAVAASAAAPVAQR